MPDTASFTNNAPASTHNLYYGLTSVVGVTNPPAAGWTAFPSNPLAAGLSSIAIPSLPPGDYTFAAEATCTPGNFTKTTYTVSSTNSFVGGTINGCIGSVGIAEGVLNAPIGSVISYTLSFSQSYSSIPLQPMTCAEGDLIINYVSGAILSAPSVANIFDSSTVVPGNLSETFSGTFITSTSATNVGIRYVLHNNSTPFVGSLQLNITAIDGVPFGGNLTVQHSCPAGGTC